MTLDEIKIIAKLRRLSMQRASDDGHMYIFEKSASSDTYVAVVDSNGNVETVWIGVFQCANKKYFPKDCSLSFLWNENES